MSIDLFQNDARLNESEFEEIEDFMHQVDQDMVHCSCCETPTAPEGLRKRMEDDLREAVCLPCYLNMFIGAEDEDVYRIIRLGQEKGLWE